MVNLAMLSPNIETFIKSTSIDIREVRTLPSQHAGHMITYCNSKVSGNTLNASQSDSTKSSRQKAEGGLQLGRSESDREELKLKERLRGKKETA